MFVALLLPIVSSLSTSPQAPVSILGPSYRFGDFDRDGTLDVYCVDPIGGDRLMRAAANGSFTDVTELTGLSGIVNSRLALWEDLDLDGWLDLYVCAADGNSRLFRNMGDGTFGDLTSTAGLAQRTDAEFFAEFIDFDGDRFADLHSVSAQGDVLMRNRGNFVFERVDLPSLTVGATVLPAPVSTEVVAAAGGSSMAAPEAQRSSRGSSTLLAATSPPAAGAARRLPAPSPLLPAGMCAGTLVDQATSTCIQATSSPTLGTLYPLSTNLNVSVGGNVGVGTTTPSAKLDVAGTVHATSTIDVRGMRTQPVDLPGPSGITSTNVFGGHAANYAYVSVIGATIAGGGSRFMFFGTPVDRPNIVSDNYAAIGGGESNQAGDMDVFPDDSEYATVAGGSFNHAEGSHSAIGGGESNLADGAHSCVPGGDSNRAQGAGALAAGSRAQALHDGTFVWADSFTGGTGSANFPSTAIDQFLVRAAGGIGFGTNAPEAPLHVMEGSAGTVTGNANASAVFERDASNFVQLLAPTANESGVMFGNPNHAAAAGIYYNSTVADGLAFRCAGNSTKMVIDSSGNVGVGVTAPGFLLHVNGSAGKPGGGSWSVASDARLKCNVAELDGALGKLLALRGVTFEYNDPESIGELAGERTGFIAQEVERVFPDWVEEGADGYKRLTVRGFEALAVEALRELRAEQEAKLADLERRLAAQEAAIAQLVRSRGDAAKGD